MGVWLPLIFAAALALTTLLLARSVLLRTQNVRRLRELSATTGGGTVASGRTIALEGRPEPSLPESSLQLDPLARWLSRAGFRTPGASFAFIAIACLAAALAIVVTVAVSRWALMPFLVNWLDGSPAGIGARLIPLIHFAPYFAGGVCAMLPWLFVRAARRRIVSDIEVELPTMLDLMATLARAGLGFDESLRRILESEPSEGALGRELRLFQLEVRSGRPRLECYQRLRERVDVPAMSSLVSALISSEQLGGSLSETLRRQSQELRSRRRERAMALAQSMPVKLVFPLVICFLPGLFVVTLGPALHQLVLMADSVLTQGGVR